MLHLRPDTFLFVELVTDSSWDSSTRIEYRLNEDGKLVHVQQGTAYTGPLPYIVISFDGRERKEYEQFTPTAAKYIVN